MSGDLEKIVGYRDDPVTIRMNKVNLNNLKLEDEFRKDEDSRIVRS